jgi:DNA-binding MarR family transcriptional regulator
LREEEAMNEPTRLERVQCVCTNLKMAGRVVGRAYDAALDELGLNVTQYAILVNVSRYQPISLMKLADHLELERTTLYRAVALMEKKGWLKSSPLEEGVARVVELTARGAEITRRAKAQWERVQGRFLAAFGKGRWSELLATLEEVREYFAAE